MRVYFPNHLFLWRERERAFPDLGDSHRGKVCDDVQSIAEIPVAEIGKRIWIFRRENVLIQSRQWWHANGSRV